jgi:hypothetical protein
MKSGKSSAEELAGDVESEDVFDNVDSVRGVKVGVGSAEGEDWSTVALTNVLTEAKEVVTVLNERFRRRAWGSVPALFISHVLSVESASFSFSSARPSLLSTSSASSSSGSSYTVGTERVARKRVLRTLTRRTIAVPVNSNKDEDDAGDAGAESSSVSGVGDSTSERL